MYFVINGLGGISATVIQDSITVGGIRLLTLELTYPRFIHSEFMTHRRLSKNAASSRAIPIATMIELVRSNPQAPIEWGRNMAGMQAKERLTGDDLVYAKADWDSAREAAIDAAEALMATGAHKQIVNRVLEPFTQMKVVVSGTEWENFFWLRNHPDAQPEIQELARVMRIAINTSAPMTILPGAWHVPYVDRQKGLGSLVSYFIDGQAITLDEAKIISSSCCAQVSYRKNDDSLEKAKAVYQRLVGSAPVHASPTEHQATPIMHDGTWAAGVTHIDADGNFWSGNFKGWIQHRQLIPNHEVKG